MLIPQNTVNSLRKFSGKNKIYYSLIAKRNANYVIDSTKHLTIAMSKKDQSLIPLLTSVHGFNTEVRGLRKVFLIETKADPKDRTKLKNFETPLKFRWIEENRKVVGLEVTIKKQIYQLLKYDPLKEKILDFIKNNPKLDDDEKLAKAIEDIIKTHRTKMKIGR